MLLCNSKQQIHQRNPQLLVPVRSLCQGAACVLTGKHPEQPINVTCFASCSSRAFFSTGQLKYICICVLMHAVWSLCCCGLQT